MSRMKHALVSDYNCADNSVQAKFVSLLKKHINITRKNKKQKALFICVLSYVCICMSRCRISVFV